MLTLGVAQLLKLKSKKPPGLIPCEEEDLIEDDQDPEHKKVKGEEMSKVNKISLKKVDEKNQKASDSHDANYALVNYKSDSATWNDNRGKDEERGNDSSMFQWGWTDLLEILILCGVLFFLWQFFRKRRNKIKEKKLTRNTKNLVDQMKASKECSISVPSAPPSASMAMPTTSTIIPFQPSPTTMVLPAHVATHKPVSGLRALSYASNIYEPP